MASVLTTFLAAHEQVCSTADLSSMGYSARQVRELVADGTLVRIRRGAFVHGPAWHEVAPWRRAELRALAVYRGLPPDDTRALSRHSALVVRRIAVHGVDDRVHLARTDDRRSGSDSVVTVHGSVPTAFIRDVRGRRVVAPELACLQVAATFGVESGLVSAESGLHLKAFTHPDLDVAMTALGPVAGRRHAERVVALAGGLSESAGESRCRWLFLLLGLPVPVQQAVILDGATRLGRVDFLFERERVIVEFDGLLKYADAADVRAEKQREDRIRRLGYEVVRLTWADLAFPARVHAWIRGAFERAAQRATS